MNFLIGFIVSLVFGLLAYSRKSVSLSGLLGGVSVGTLLYAFSGPQGFSLLAFFFILASLFTRLGERRKQRMGVAQPNEGRRRAREALANCLPGLFFAFFFWHTGAPLYQLGFVSSFAEAFADTTATELGQLCGRRFFSVPGFQTVPVGTRGACSVEGTLAGILAAFAMGLLGFSFGWYPFLEIASVVLGATVGFIGESLLAPVLADHEGRNVMGALIGGVSGMMISALLPR